MQTHPVNFWYKFDLHRGKIALFLVLLSWQCLGQHLQQETYDRNKPKIGINLPNYDERLLHYGFFLALNYNQLNITHSDKFVQDTAINTITPSGTPGFALGFLLNVRLADQLAFKIVPSVGFYQRNLLYSYKDKTRLDTLQSVETTFIELQFLMKYRSVRRKNTRMYLIGGVKPSIRAGGKNYDPKDPKFVLGRLDFSIEYGAGLEIYFPYFKWSPELRFSHGLVNMNPAVTNGYNDYLNSALTHTVTLYFFFE